MIKAIKSILPKEGKYHLAVSMGVDSVAALFWMKWKGYEVIPLHFDHNLRAQNGIMHERFLRLCEKLGLQGKSEVWSKGAGTEAECRDARLDFYRRVANGATIATAHHLDDWIENYLLNCLRGHPHHSPFEIQSGFAEYKIIHPFLPSRKKDFVEFLERNGWMEWVVEDETNKVVRGSRRNWIRRKIIPEMNEQRLSLEKFAKRRIRKMEEVICARKDVVCAESDIVEIPSVS
jgi:tRNA(Ile)-lysidine synthetase-like protein